MKKNRTIYLLFVLISVQSCVIYQKVPVKLSEATNQGRAKVVSKTGKTKKYYEITQSDSIYYGNKKNTKHLYKNGKYYLSDKYDKLNADDIESIFLKNKTSSLAVSILIT